MRIVIKEKNSVVLTNESEVFNDTELSSENFSVEIKPLKKVDTINLMQECVVEDTNKINVGEYSKQLFTTSIVNASGFTNEDDEELECDSALKDYLWEDAPEELITAIKDVVDGFKKADEEKKSEIEDLQEITQNGLPYQEQVV